MTASFKSPHFKPPFVKYEILLSYNTLSLVFTFVQQQKCRANYKIIFPQCLDEKELQGAVKFLCSPKPAHRDSL